MFELKVLDHGFVRLRNLAGPTRRNLTQVDPTNGAVLTQVQDDEGKEYVLRDFDADDIDPAQAARMSFEQMDSKRTYDDDMRLNKYLLINDHSSPFEMIQVWLEVKVPIFVDRQMVRHRTWGRNESSGRYIVLPEEWYIPATVGGKAKDKKQGQEDNLSLQNQELFKGMLHNQCNIGYSMYLQSLDMGVAPEHARMFLHVNHYVHWIGTVNLANLFKFLRLRANTQTGEGHAQVEARVYAEAIVELLRPHLPGLMALFDDYVRKP